MSRRLSTCRSAVGRYYDPQTGQFLTVDPLIEQTGQPYSYAAGDPVRLTDPSGQSIPFDNTTAQNIYRGNGGSYGAHAGPPVWGVGQLNGYSCLQSAVDQNAPGLRQVFGDLSDPQGWAYWGPLLGTIGLAPALAIPIEDAIPLAIDSADVQAALLRSQVRTVAGLLRDVAVGNSAERATAIDLLKERVDTANFYMSQAMQKSITSERGYLESLASSWVRGFLRGY